MQQPCPFHIGRAGTPCLRCSVGWLDHFGVSPSAMPKSPDPRQKKGRGSIPLEENLHV